MSKHRHHPQFICFLFSLSGVRLSPFGTAATIGLLYQTQMVVIVEKLVE
jgi:hypothetical protein